MKHGNPPSVVVERQLNWTASPPGLELHSNQIQLWFADLNQFLSSEMEKKFLNILTSAEKNRAEKIINTNHRKLYLGGRIGLKFLLSGLTGIENQNLSFGYGSRGKPEILNPLSQGKLEFNYTLSKNYGLYAFSWDCSVGVDLEIFPRTINAELLAKRKLAPSEQNTLQQIPKIQRNDAMLACWTRKEAYGKVLGVGIRYMVNEVALFTDLNADSWCVEPIGLFEKEDAQSPGLYEFGLLGGVQVSLPAQGSASLMYSKTKSGQHRSEEPELTAFQLKI